VSTEELEKYVNQGIDKVLVEELERMLSKEFDKVLSFIPK
jgi:hypothetical protein